jgi:hypothetical protein
MAEKAVQIEESVETWEQARLEALATEAGEAASRFYLLVAQERAKRPRSQWGRLGVRVRPLRAARSAPGTFAIEWFTRRWVNKTATGAQTFTTYIRRGTGDRYERAGGIARGGCRGVGGRDRQSVDRGCGDLTVDQARPEGKGRGRDGRRAESVSARVARTCCPECKRSRTATVSPNSEAGACACPARALRTASVP